MSLLGGRKQTSKKASRDSRLKTIRKYSIITALSKYFSVVLLCKIAKVSKSGYYKNLKVIKVKSQDEIIVKEIFYHNEGKVGTRQIKINARKYYGVIINRKKVQRIMRKLYLICKIRKVNKINQQVTEEQYLKENILSRQFKYQKAETVVCTDITYLKYNNKECYLAAYIDAKTSVILGYRVSNNLKSDFVIESTQELLSKYPQINMIHTDRGPQYICKKFNDLIIKNQIIHSMSRPSTPLDNAVIESFWGHMKDYIDLRSCKTFKEVIDVIDEYMYDYNNRPQWNKKKLSPLEYKEFLLAA